MRATLIEKQMPGYQMRQVDRVRVGASPGRAWRVVRNLDTQSHFLSRMLFALRALPERLFKRSENAAALIPPRSTIEDFTGPGKGFKILAEEPGREIVVGSVGKFWKPAIEWAEIEPSSFGAFSAAGYGKLAWSLRVDPDGHGGSWITWDLRVGTTDTATWRFFRYYWFLIGSFSHLLRRSALHAMARELGGSPSEERLALTADELVPQPKYQKTMSITIEAPPERVWPWLTQMGCRRGGWYSLDYLDNGGVPSARQLIPDLQQLRVGQVLPWKPKGNDGFTVLAFEENKHLILGTASLLKGPRAQASAFDDTWAFVLEPVGPGATRLITRVRADFAPSGRMTLLTGWLSAAHVIMERAQLRNLKRRIEYASSSSPVLLREAPHAQFRGQVEVDVAATPEDTMRSFGAVTSREITVAWILGELRYLPARLLGKKPPAVDRDEPFTKGLMEQGSVVLTSGPRELVIASAGKYHQLTDQQFVRFTGANAFRAFQHPDYQKLFISVRAEPAGAARSKLILEHWTWGLSPKSATRFSKYWLFIKPSGNFVSKILLKAAKRRAERAPRELLRAPA
ncbi:MAG TPA: hypothetical protein VFV50_03740 [Bdellovibrionales bacterium]|nr:hypothetical protein [Bdellovibrionales bacterium]